VHDAIRSMLDRYDCQTRDDYVNALREILQELALLGLWRAKFFEHAAFYGGTALRVLYGLDRYSEDLDFSLLTPDAGFTFSSFGEALLREIRSFGFEVDFQPSEKATRTKIESAFVKANTYSQLLVIDTGDDLLRGLHPGKMLKVTPIISKDNMVRLNIALEVTALESTTDFRPTTLKRNINTTVIVRDGGTVVLGGLIEDLGVTADYKLPCLGSVPLIGWLFRSRAKAGEKSNLYIFLTPHVINNPKDALNVYQMKREHIDRIKSGHIKMYEKGLKNAPSGGTLQPQQISPGEAVKKPLPPAPGSGAVDKPTQSGSSATEPKSP